jgi:hypothetical protein
VNGTFLSVNVWVFYLCVIFGYDSSASNQDVHVGGSRNTLAIARLSCSGVWKISPDSDGAAIWAIDSELESLHPTPWPIPEALSCRLSYSAIWVEQYLWTFNTPIIWASSVILRCNVVVECSTSSPCNSGGSWSVERCFSYWTGSMIPSAMIWHRAFISFTHASSESKKITICWISLCSWISVNVYQYIPTVSIFIVLVKSLYVSIQSKCEQIRCR